MRKNASYDFLIVGAGYAGAVCAERFATKNNTVLICDRRHHIAGNAYDHFDDSGILVHKYGPHIFHTNSAAVYQYLSRFTSWRPYQHRVLASVDALLVPIPINLDTVNRLYGLNLTPSELELWFRSCAEHRSPLLTSEDFLVSRIGRDLYEKIFRGYTRKQWARDPSELDASVARRIPVRTNRDNRYFTDVYQFMPKHGYTHMFENLLDHPNITLALNTDYRDIGRQTSYRRLIYTGCIDEFFDFCFGKLPYRSVSFRHETYAAEQFQTAPVINYPSEAIPFTRITEFKWLTGQKHPHTSVAYEYPCAEGDPYYPVLNTESRALYAKYALLARGRPDVHFVGRLAAYKYYNMDQVVANALRFATHLMQ